MTSKVANVGIAPHLPNNKFNKKHKGLDDGNSYGEIKQNFTVGDFCQRITSHGLLDWYEAKTSVGKTLWAVLILASVTLLTYQITMEFYEYYTGAIQTSFSFVPVTGLKLPQIYICPLSFTNKYCVSNWTEYREQIGIFKRNAGSLLNQTGSSWQMLSPYLSGHTAPSGADTPSEFICGPRNQGYLKQVAMAVPDYFVECNFNGQNVNCDCIVETYLDKEYGVCYLVDVSKVSNGIQVTENIGLNLVLDTHTEYFPDGVDLNSKDTLVVAGAQIRAENPVGPSSFGGTFVQAGTYARMRLIAQEINLIDLGYSTIPQHCIQENQYKMKYFNTTYSAELCRMDCMQAMIKEACHCVMPFDARWVRLTERFTNSCTEQDFDQCVKPNVQTSGHVKSQLRQCVDLCYKPCNSWEYEITLSYLRLPYNKEITERKFMDLVKLACPYKNISLTLECPSFDPPTTFPPTSPPTTASEVSPDMLARRNETNDATTNGPPPYPYGNGPPPYPYGNGPPPYPYGNPMPCTKPNPFACPVVDPCAYRSGRNWDAQYIILDIAFSKLQYTQLQQSPPRTITTLLSNIGGQAGLWTGASIFTIVQAIIFTSYLTCNKINRKP